MNWSELVNRRGEGGRAKATSYLRSMMPSENGEVFWAWRGVLLAK